MRKVNIYYYILINLILFRLNLEKVMLTVSKHNKIGQSFFKNKMKYTLKKAILFL